MSKAKKESSNSEITKKFQKKTHREHILSRPGTYLGSVHSTTEPLFVFDENEKKIVKKNITYTPAFFKTVDELMVNARDHQVNEKSCKTIKISFSKEKGWIKVYNDGTGIPIVEHEEHKIYIPELIFGHLLTSTNYDDTEERIVGGLNGYGAKLTNIYSKKFIVEVVDTSNRKFVQEYRKNMSEKDEPTITKSTANSTPYVLITYYPDFEKFNSTGLTDDDISWIHKRAYDIAACTRENVKVYVNDELLKIKNFKDYIGMYYKDLPTLIYKEVNERWKVGIVFSPDNGGQNVSFVNAIDTYNGGTHVDYIMNQIVDKTIDNIKKKQKLNVKPALVKEHLNLFVDATIVKPDFPSQTKCTLSTKASNFGSTCNIPDDMMKELFSTKLIDLVVDNAKFKEISALAKTDGKKQVNINIPKLEDARLAGTKHSLECRLILTEGDSAKAFAMSGLTVIGKEKYGVFPLRGKILNVRNATPVEIGRNPELINLKQIMGLKQGVTYKDQNDLKKLRYGGIVILTDADSDGTHIKGLIINMFQFFWPELMKIDGFIQTLSTPLIKAFKKTDKKEKNPIVFYSENDFNNWSSENEIEKWNVFYYKGLGTSTEKEQKQAFRDYDKRVVSFIWENVDKNVDKNVNTKKDKESDTDSDSNEDSDTESTTNAEKVSSKKKKTTKKGKIALNVSEEIMKSKSYNAILLGFDENLTDERKEWLKKYDRNDVLEYTRTKIYYSEFINRDLIHFSNYNNIRQIPSIMDGMKPSQRKILYVCLKENIKNLMKVNQLASKVSERTQYKHGETSLEGTIVGMAQDYPGANNINLLVPQGNFGYRNEAGKNHASSRYIKTCLENITDKIFNKYDNCILEYLKEEGDIVEPEFYYPIIPMVLVNGAIGMGTGYSTFIPQYNPLDICNNLQRYMDGKDMVSMTPWYHGFRGEIDKINNFSFNVKGVAEVKDEKTIVISEIPVVGSYCATDHYEEKVIKPLAGMITQPVKKEDKKNEKKDDKKDDKKKQQEVILSSYFKHPGNNVVKFDLEFIGGQLQKMVKRGENEIYDTFKLTSKISLTNMHLWNSKGVITKYTNVLDIIKEFYDVRLDAYQRRKEYHIKVLKNDLDILDYRVKFILDYLNKKIIIERQSEEVIIERLKELKYPKLHHSIEAPEEKKSYDYITLIKLFELTKEKIDELNKQRDKKKAEYDEYNSLGAKDLWKRELADFVESYKKWLVEKADREAEDEDSDNSSSTVKKKRNVKSK
jgi:DNA topoisomerase-2